MGAALSHGPKAVFLPLAFEVGHQVIFGFLFHSVCSLFLVVTFFWGCDTSKVVARRTPTGWCCDVLQTDTLSHVLSQCDRGATKTYLAE